VTPFNVRISKIGYRDTAHITRWFKAKKPKYVDVDGFLMLNLDSSAVDIYRSASASISE